MLCADFCFSNHKISKKQSFWLLLLTIQVTRYQKTKRQSFFDYFLHFRLQDIKRQTILLITTLNSLKPSESRAWSLKTAARVTRKTVMMLQMMMTHHNRPRKRHPNRKIQICRVHPTDNLLDLTGCFDIWIVNICKHIWLFLCYALSIVGGGHVCRDESDTFTTSGQLEWLAPCVI